MPRNINDGTGCRLVNEVLSATRPVHIREYQTTVARLERLPQLHVGSIVSFASAVLHSYGLMMSRSADNEMYSALIMPSYTREYNMYHA